MAADRTADTFLICLWYCQQYARYLFLIPVKVAMFAIEPHYLPKNHKMCRQKANFANKVFSRYDTPPPPPISYGSDCVSIAPSHRAVFVVIRIVLVIVMMVDKLRDTINSPWLLSNCTQIVNLFYIDICCKESLLHVVVVGLIC